MLHERIELSEGTGSDNAGYAFGTDAFLGNTSGTLRYLSNGTSATGQGSYDDGNLVWHAGNDGSGSGLDTGIPPGPIILSGPK